ncbi:hypothetical protein [Occultella kanbiaonis]|uniref:hypothetical protein n=1 Tax=Occultella kanbiaonis TaxID=2675754 RepID=UPI0013D62FA5|nr:hypothetical protein [Occultella kanbiaonis]
MEIIWTTASRKHRIGRGHALHVMQHGTVTETTTTRGEIALRYVGADDRGIELEFVSVVVPDGLLVIHVMPTALRRNHG